MGEIHYYKENGVDEVKHDETVLEVPQHHIEIIQDELWKMRPTTTKLAIQESLKVNGIVLQDEEIQTNGLSAGISSKGGHVRFHTVRGDTTKHYRMVAASPKEQVEET